MNDETAIERNPAKLPTDAYPQIGDYAIIGDCRTAALIGKEGAIEWLCLPAFSSPSVFASILDREKGGHVSVRAADTRRVERRYLEDTNVLETRFTTPTGILRVVDFMPVIFGPEGDDQLQASREILRIVECVQGEVTAWFHYRPRPDYARHTPRLTRRGKLGYVYEQRGNVMYFNTDIDAQPTEDGTALEGSVTLHPRERRYVSLIHADRSVAVLPPLGREADKRLDLTIRWWRQWASRIKYDGPQRKIVRRSALALKLMTYAPTGALVGAPTTSLPERIGGHLNWDYRYCWPRDAGLTIRSLIEVGLAGEARAFLGWLLHATRATKPRILPIYDIHGRPARKEFELKHLEGFKHSKPVLVGNAARSQLQLDVYGSVVQAAADYVRSGGVLGPLEQKLIVRLGQFVCRHWRQPDHGIWEFRDKKRHNTFSKVMCWVALDRLIRLHQAHSLRLDARRIGRERDAIRETIETEGWNSDLKAYVGELKGDWADAALLLMPRFGYIEADHPRMMSTLRFIERRLLRNGLMHRYMADVEPTRRSEGAFGICGFWYVDCLARCGQLDRARHAYRRLLGTANELGLFSEESDPETFEALGNFPQALTHIGVILAAQTIRHHEQNREREDPAGAVAWR